MNAAAPPAATACAKCGASNPPGAAFCANCGAPFTASPPPMPPPSIPRAPMPAGGSMAQAALPMDPHQAFTAALNALSAAGHQVAAQQPPMGIQFTAVKKSFWSTFNIPARYRGEITLAPAGQRQTVARVSVKIDWGASAGIIALNIVCLLILGFFILPIILVAYSFWYVGSKWSREIAEDLAGKVTAAAGQGAWPVQPPPAAYTPPPQAPAFTPPQPPRPIPGPAAAPAAGGDVHDKLRKLKELHDLGVLSAAEYEAKRAELVAQL